MPVPPPPAAPERPAPLAQAFEFACQCCRATVRVPVANAGKKGRCPTCREVIQIPRPELEPAAPLPSPIAKAAPIAADAIEFACTSCQATVRVPRANAGKKGRCPSCREVVQIPALRTQPSPAPQPAPVALPKPAPPKPPIAKPPPPKPAPPAAKPAPPRVLPPPLPPQDVLAPIATKVAAIPPHGPELRHLVLSGFVGQMQRPEVTDSYKRGILVSSIVMILVPLLYGTFVCILAAAVLVYLLFGLALVFVGGIIGIFLYGAGAVVGCVLLIFLIKPFFHFQRESDGLRTISPQEEPLLFEFVHKICDQVQAPYPAQIDVDCSVNAAAGIVSMSQSKLRLIIGLPLVAGLSLQQFAGVLAHEFGHFNQAAGMRLTNIINRTDSWLARVVFERDSWDEWLDDACRGSGFRLGMILQLARFAVWCVRKLLYGVLFGSRAVVGYMMREMEFDADKCEMRLAGSETFESTFRQIAFLSFAHRDAIGHLQFHFREGRLADDLPRLIIAALEDIPPKVRRKMWEAVEKSETGTFDTHPCDRERIACGRAENAPGVFRSHLPASALFRDFKRASAAVTWDYYCDVFDQQVPRDKIRSIDEILTRNEARKKIREASIRYLAGTIDWIRPVRLPAYELPEEADASHYRQEILDARDYMLQNVVAYRALQKELDKADERATRTAQALAIFQAGTRPNLEVEPPFTSLHATSNERQQLLERLSRLHEQASTFEVAAGRRLYAALSMLGDPRIQARVPDSAAVRKQIEQILPILSVFARNLPRLVQMRDQFAVISGLLEHIEEHNARTLIEQLIHRTGELRTNLWELRDPLEMLEYPFDHAEGYVTVANFVLKVVPTENEPQAVFECSADFMQDLMLMYYRCTGRLCEIAEQVEAAIKLEPAPFPPAPEEE